MAASAGKYGSASGWLLVDGFNLTAAKLQGLRCKVESVTERTDGLGDAYPAHTPVGLSKVELAQDGAFWDTSTGQIHDALEDHLGTSPQRTARIACCGFAGHTIGESFVGLQGAFTHEYEVLGQRENLTKANAAYRITGQVDHGVILQGLAAKTADWNTERADAVDYTAETTQRVLPITSNSQAHPSVVTTPVDHGLTSGDSVVIAGVLGSNADINGEQTVTVLSPTTFSVPVDATTSPGTGGTFVRANSANGAVGYQQVTAFSGFTGFIGKIRDSADDITFADLITFADVTRAPAKERATVAGTIDRYLAYDGHVTGSGSITVFVGLSRS